MDLISQTYITRNEQGVAQVELEYRRDLMDRLGYMVQHRCTGCPERVTYTYVEQGDQWVDKETGDPVSDGHYYRIILAKLHHENLKCTL